MQFLTFSIRDVDHNSPNRATEQPVISPIASALSPKQQVFWWHIFSSLFIPRKYSRNEQTPKVTYLSALRNSCVCTGCRPRCTALSTHTTNWNTWCHNTALLITMYFYWLFLQKFNFSQAQCKLPEGGPNGPKYVGANIRYFNVNFNILYV
jgi:hypothetical protein